MKLFVIIIAVIGLTSAATYFLFFSGYLQITNLHIESRDKVLTDALRVATQGWLNENLWGLKWRDNLLFLSADSLSALLYDGFPSIASVRIAKKFPHGLGVFIEEKERYGIWCLVGQVPTQCFQFDTAGKAYKETLPSVGFLIFAVYDYRPRIISLGQPVAENDWFSNLSLARELLSKYLIKVGEFIIPADSFDEFYTKTAEGWTILFSISSNVPRQIDVLASFLRQRETEKNNAPLQYIDLRVQGRIYFR